MMKILIVDDHTLFRDGMKHLLQALEQELDIHESHSVLHAAEILQADSFDLILLDLQLGDAKGLESLSSVRQHTPETPIIVLSAEQDPHVIRQSVEQGAMGFISKSSTHMELLSAIEHILAGGVYLPPEATSLQAATQANNNGKTESEILLSFSVRQREVLCYLVQGKPNKTISSKMNISENTVKAHLSAIFRTLGARNRTEAVYFAARAGMPLE